MSRAGPSNWKKKLAISATSFVVIALLAWSISIVVRSRDLYRAAKTGFRGWNGRIYQSDPEMGLAAIPFARASETFPIGPELPSRIDGEGFRVPVDAPDSPRRDRPIFLALGCSYTYGSAEPAEETFAWKVAQHYHGTCLNAGLCSGSAAQELLLARELIPRIEPDYVLLQYSPWLIERASTEYAPTYMGKIPMPVFVKASDGSVRIAKPAFTTLAFDLPIADYRATPEGLGDFLGFVLRVGGPLLVHDDFHTKAVAVRRAWGDLPRIASRDEIDAFVYPEIARLCSDHGAKLVIVGLENGAKAWRVPDVIANLGAPVAYGTNRLRERLPSITRETYNNVYLHVAGDPPVLVDAHPNAHAHTIIAETIIEAIDARQ